MNIPVLPPDVNESFSQFTVIKSEESLGGQENRDIPPQRTVSASAEAAPPDSPNHYPLTTSHYTYRIRFGLVTIKNFGQGISTAIIDERKRGGKFKSLADFLDRVKDKNLNKKSLESLVKAGAMDWCDEDRGVMLANMDLMLDYNKESSNTDEDQTSLFGMMADASSVPTLRLNDASKAEMRDKLTWEKELLGLYVSGHPLEKYRDVITKKDIDIKRALEKFKDGESVVLAVIINEVRLIQTKKNETMAFITVSDFSGSSDAVVFPRTYKEHRALIDIDKCLAIKATINTRNGEKGFVIERVKGL
jgi:DNA polymerase-3 subunit alpha